MKTLILDKICRDEDTCEDCALRHSTFSNLEMVGELEKEPIK
jgi:hypothetical protein